LLGVKNVYPKKGRKSTMDPKYTPKVWEHFKLEKFAGIAQCNGCDAILKAKWCNNWLENNSFY
jgi:hypothetical protein